MPSAFAGQPESATVVLFSQGADLANFQPMQIKAIESPSVWPATMRVDAELLSGVDFRPAKCVCGCGMFASQCGCGGRSADVAKCVKK